MARSLTMLAILALVVFFFAGCAAHQPDPAFEPYDFMPAVKDGKVDKKVDNFLILIDSTQSMAKRDVFRGQIRFQRAWDTVMNLGRTLPDLGYVGMIRVVGATPRLVAQKTVLEYGPRFYTQETFKIAMEKINYAQGRTPLGGGLEATVKDLAYSTGPIALIVVSDGVNNAGDPLAAAGKLKEAYGDRICIYTVQIGDDKNGGAMLKQVAQKGGCGFATTEEALSTPVGMARFVEQVFLK
ncbi:MAG: vWA domain-containing protein [Desulfatibacillaceae bacterium]|nr:vWA domain-containing protein [Desulfatibacillaceae bacterium]